MAHAGQFFDRTVQFDLLLQLPIGALQGPFGLLFLVDFGEVHQQEWLVAHVEPPGSQTNAVGFVVAQAQIDHLVRLRQRSHIAGTV